MNSPKARAPTVPPMLVVKWHNGVRIAAPRDPCSCPGSSWNLYSAGPSLAPNARFTVRGICPGSAEDAPAGWRPSAIRPQPHAPLTHLRSTQLSL